MIALSTLCEGAEIVLVRDAPISTLGFVDIPLASRLVFAMDGERLALALRAEGVSAVLTTPAFARIVGMAGNPELGIASAPDPRRAFVALHNRLAVTGTFYGDVGPTVIDPTARIHPRAHIDATGVVVGPDCRIDAGAIIMTGTRLDAGVRVHAGAVIGACGFQTMCFGAEVVDLEHAGGVEIGARVVVMANAVIARAVFRQSTTIGADCRIGNGAFVSHNAAIEPRCLIGHGAIVAGNARLGADVTLGPGAICLDRLAIGDGATLTAGAVVTRSVARGQRVSGNFAVPHDRLIRAVKDLAGGQAH